MSEDGLSNQHNITGPVPDSVYYGKNGVFDSETCLFDQNQIAI